MKIATYNVNGIYARLPVLLRFFLVILRIPRAGTLKLKLMAFAIVVYTCRMAILLPDPNLISKLQWFERLKTSAAALLSLDMPVILAGDINVMPSELDVYKLKIRPKT